MLRLHVQSNAKSPANGEQCVALPLRSPWRNTWQFGVIIWLLLCGTNSNGDELEQAINRVPDSFLETKLDAIRAVEKFKDNQTSLQKVAVKRIDADARTIVKNNSLTVVQRQVFMQQANDLIDWINLGGELPDCEMTLEYAYDFGLKSLQNRQRMQPVIEKLYKQLNRSGDVDIAQKIKIAFDELHGVLDAQNILREGTVLRGLRRHVRGTEPTSLQIKIEQTDGRQFVGIVENKWEYANHPKHALAGELDNLTLTATTGQSVAAFGAQMDGSWTYKGIVLGQFMIGEFVGVGPRGRAGGGYFIVKRKDR